MTVWIAAPFAVTLAFAATALALICAPKRQESCPLCKGDPGHNCGECQGTGVLS